MKNLATFIMVIGTLLISTESASQSHIKLAGQVVTSTGEPASFAHVYIKDKNMGGTTDAEGFFKYFISEEYANDQLQITLVGFKTYGIEVEELVANPGKIITLEENVIELESVTIYAPQDIMRSALKTIVEKNDPAKYYSRLGIITLDRKQGEDYTLFEEIAFNFYYRGMLDDRPLIGYEPIAQRRSIDYSTFLYLKPRGGTRTSSAGYFFGSFVESSLVLMAKQLDSLDLDITDIVEEGEEKLYVITRRQKSGGLIHYYVDIDQSRLRKVEYISNASQMSLYVGGSPFNSSKYNRFRYLFIDTYHFENLDGRPVISEVQHRTKTQYIERLTGYIHRVYDDNFSVKFFNLTSKAEQPKKYKDEFRLPLTIKYDQVFWDQMKDEHAHEIDPRIAISLGEQKTLEGQFKETDGKVVRGNAPTGTSFQKKDQKIQAKIDDVDRFIRDLENNNYKADYPPALGWEDIPKLLEIADSKIVIDRFPRNILSRLYLQDCHTGIVALWLIDSIRKSEGKRVRKAWYVSPMPLLQDEKDREKTRARGGRNEFIPTNSDEKLVSAYEAFDSWWKNAQNMSRSKSKRVNPLQESGLNWLWR
ncbi:MAG: carboxypeptidase-like regulatory domain-containing protein [Ekhidna sp.]